MKVPKQELPNEEWAAELARRNLPEHYRLIDVRSVYGSEVPGFIPSDFEIVVEYENRLDEILVDSMDKLAAYHAWADALIENIRVEWPPQMVRISFLEKCSESA